MLVVEQGSKKIVLTPKRAPTAPPQLAPVVVSEHGQGGGSTSSDTGKKPTQQQTQAGHAKPASTQPAPAVVSEHGQGGGSTSSDTGKKPTQQQTQTGYATPAATQPAPAVTSEHGQGGGSSSTDTGRKPTPEETQTGFTSSTATVGKQVPDRAFLVVEPVPPSGTPPTSSAKHTAVGIAMAVARLPKWMLEGSTPPATATKSGALPRALTAAANPEWHSPSGREHFAFTYLKQTLKLSTAAAAALVGNMSIESRSPTGKDLTPGIWQSGSPPSTHTFTDPNTGYGIAQWTYPARKEALAAFAGSLPVSNFGVELAFVAHELSHPAASPLIQPDTLATLRNAGSIQEATAIAMAAYEHPNTYKQVPAYPSVVRLLNEWHQGSPTGANRSDQSGYNARLAAAQKIAKTYG